MTPKSPRNYVRDGTGSFVSALVGWGTINLLINVAAVLSWHTELVGALSIIIALVSAFVIFFVWLLALLPLYLFVPFESRLWRWPLCTLCGTVAGAAIMYAMSQPAASSDSAQWSLFSSLSAVILGGIPGGVSCLFGSLTLGYFNPQHHTAPPPAPRAAPTLKRIVRRLEAKFFELAGQ